MPHEKEVLTKAVGIQSNGAAAAQEVTDRVFVGGNNHEDFQEGFYLWLVYRSYPSIGRVGGIAGSTGTGLSPCKTERHAYSEVFSQQELSALSADG